jgi:hypothetical protein
MKAGASLLLCVILLGLAMEASATNPPRDNAIAQRLSEMEDGKLHIVYEAREGVWGDGKNTMTFSDGDEHHVSWRSGRQLEPGPVRVLFTLHDGEITDVKTRVGAWMPPQH